MVKSIGNEMIQLGVGLLGQAEEVEEERERERERERLGYVDQRAGDDRSMKRGST